MRTQAHIHLRTYARTPARTTDHGEPIGTHAFNEARYHKSIVMRSWTTHYYTDLESGILATSMGRMRLPRERQGNR